MVVGDLVFGERSDIWIVLLDWRDAPTDGVGDYCTFLGVLGQVLRRHSPRTLG